MKKLIYLMLMVSIICASAFIVLTNWKVKEPYTVKFSSGKIHGEFKGLKADIKFDKIHPEEAEISASIDANSLSTGFFLKNIHAKDALDVEKYPMISFVSTAVNKSGNTYNAVGKLTMKGVTKPVTIRFTFDERGSSGGVFKGDFTLAPRDFNITHKGTPDRALISLNVPVAK